MSKFKKSDKPSVGKDVCGDNQTLNHFW
jgi:hypothetical protein